MCPPCHGPHPNAINGYWPCFLLLFYERIMPVLTNKNIRGNSAKAEDSLNKNIRLRNEYGVHLLAERIAIAPQRRAR